MEFLAKAGTLYDVVLYTIGMKILKDQVRLAAYALLQAVTPSYFSKKMEALAFLQGSGLEYVIDSYGLEIDPEKFRDTFFSFVEHQRLSHKSVVSSATT